MNIILKELSESDQEEYIKNVLKNGDRDDIVATYAALLIAEIVDIVNVSWTGFNREIVRKWSADDLHEIEDSAIRLVMDWAIDIAKG